MPGFERRLPVRPGLTGLAQIYDKIDDTNEKYRYDMEYLQNLSPFLDARFIIMSVWNTLIVRWAQRPGKVNLDDLVAAKTDTPDTSDDQAESTGANSDKDES